MKKVFLLAVFMQFTFAINAQECSTDNAAAFQRKINSEYANPKESPLTKADLKKFKSLDFYTIDTDFCVKADFVRTPNEKPFAMPTTTSRMPMYVKYGELHFTLKGKKCKLDVFQDMTLSKIAEYKDHLFLPFTDLTSGDGSYGGGRYIDLTVPEGKTIIVDFNTAYNPYCVYNHTYSCPIPPEQNDLQVAVKAGVKDFNK